MYIPNRKSSNGYYLYVVENSGNMYWTISNRVGSTTFLVMGVAPTNAACPDGKIFSTYFHLIVKMYIYISISYFYSLCR